MSNTRVGIIELPEVAEYLRQAGYDVLGGGQLREAGAEILQAQKTDPTIPVIVGDSDTVPAGMVTFLRKIGASAKVGVVELGGATATLGALAAATHKTPVSLAQVLESVGVAPTGGEIEPNGTVAGSAARPTQHPQPSQPQAQPASSAWGAELAAPPFRAGDRVWANLDGATVPATVVNARVDTAQISYTGPGGNIASAQVPVTQLRAADTQNAPTNPNEWQQSRGDSPRTPPTQTGWGAPPQQPQSHQPPNQRPQAPATPPTPAWASGGQTQPQTQQPTAPPWVGGQHASPPTPPQPDTDGWPRTPTQPQQSPGWGAAPTQVEHTPQSPWGAPPSQAEQQKPSPWGAAPTQMEHTPAPQDVGTPWGGPMVPSPRRELAASPPKRGQLQLEGRDTDQKTLFVFSAKGGVAKTSTARALAQRAATAAHLHVILIDANRGQGDQRSFLRLHGERLPDMYQVAAGIPAYEALIPPNRINQIRGSALTPINFGVVLAPTPDLADSKRITPELYRKVLDAAQQMADLVVVDLQMFDADALRDKGSMAAAFVEPALRSGGWGLGLTEASLESTYNLDYIFQEMVRGGAPKDHLMSAVTKLTSETTFNLAEAKQILSNSSEFMGTSQYDGTLGNELTAGGIGETNTAMTPLLDAVIEKVTGRPVDSGATKRRRRGWFGRRRK